MAVFDFLRKGGDNFYQWFEDAADNVLQASHELRNLCYNFQAQDPQQTADRLHELEHRGDSIGHEIYDALNKTFVTPLDREDIIRLYSALDDVIDFVHSSADMMAVYKVQSVTPVAQQLADCIVGCAEEIAKAMPKLRKRNELEQILPSVIHINSLENQADNLLRAGLVELFSRPQEKPQDVVEIIKWRDIYEEMEEATDKAEDIADVLRGLVIKHA
jgi:predicted phosphate transport protein (TIGR00153 family)